jgi:hypothetical protein
MRVPPRFTEIINEPGNPLTHFDNEEHKSESPPANPTANSSQKVNYESVFAPENPVDENKEEPDGNKGPK